MGRRCLSCLGLVRRRRQRPGDECGLLSFPTRIRAQGRHFLAFVTVQTRHTPICQSAIAAPNVSRGLRGNHLLVITDFYSATTIQQFTPARIGVGARALRSPGSAWMRSRDWMNTPKVARALANFAVR